MVPARYLSFTRPRESLPVERDTDDHFKETPPHATAKPASGPYLFYLGMAAAWLMPRR